MTKGSKVLITGAAGFIGFHLSDLLCRKGYNVTGIDNVNDYYDVKLKEDRLRVLHNHKSFTFHKIDISKKEPMAELFKAEGFTYVVNLAAQAGVRHSIQHPHTYIESNVTGFLNVLEGCRHNAVKHLVYASSSSVYGANTSMPFSIHDNVDHPLSLYAATKKANELMAHSYSSLYSLPTTGLRFFSAYGPYGRPDMALFVFTKSILEGKPIDVYNHGKMKRDFTYVDDITESIERLLHKVPVANPSWNYHNPDPSTSYAPFRIFNIGNNDPVELVEFIDHIEKKLGRPAIRNNMEMQEGDVPQSFADVQDLYDEIDFKPSTPIETGVGKFVDWYLDYYHK
ncbi:MAG TPA: NAD-dependent epimerase [Cyclobacteriaceae bacterium]|nr:NAD-dependent epimerase [Cyclobacteriaceae bacterium]